jgi:glycerol-3-phosphate O-acyltransferase
MSGIYHLPPTQQIAHSLQRRSLKRLERATDDELFTYLADTIFLERKRLEKEGAEDVPIRYRRALVAGAKATQQSRSDMVSSISRLVECYAYEVHNQFSSQTYQFASKVLPGALTRLLTAAQPTQLLGADFNPGSRITVQGPVEKLRKLSSGHTLIYTPTHLSNLDSPLIGFALSESNLPPVIYGAGLNLFSNPLMAFFMSRLGAYTVDRRKKNALYKDVLKDYSIEAVRRGCHSLFFPGGTRSRSGRIETRLKKGLLGTAISAWQESLADGKNSCETLFVPCTLSFSLTLEAETLIDDALSEEGQSRYIISDDEFSEAREVAAFARNSLNMDSSVYIRFGEPMDVVGNPVDGNGTSLGPGGDPIDRREYVTDRYGTVVQDSQRDMVYTRILSERIAKAYQRDNIALPTHVAAHAAWRLLCKKHPRLDDVQRAMLPPGDRRLPRASLLGCIDRLSKQIEAYAEEGRICSDLPGNASDLLQVALERFGSYHRTRALAVRGASIEVGSKLALYYGNRLNGYGFEI